MFVSVYLQNFLGNVFGNRLLFFYLRLKKRLNPPTLAIFFNIKKSKLNKTVTKNWYSAHFCLFHFISTKIIRFEHWKSSSWRQLTTISCQKVIKKKDCRHTNPTFSAKEPDTHPSPPPLPHSPCPHTHVFNYKTCGFETYSFLNKNFLCSI